MLRAAEERDLETVRRWRNHPLVREASFTTHEILPAEHARWWAGVRDDPTRRVLIYGDDPPRGVVTFSGLGGFDRSASWGFYLDLAGLEQDGGLLRAWVGIERAALGHAFGVLGLLILHGEVLAANAAVRELHRRFGFTETSVYHREIDGVSREVVAIRLDREDAR
ncbi:GNAT family N-acetyltransferase [Spongiactinospora gelatinilytica]|uniref:GNAT family N-acetyltransferase n=1 Tax=Spongiactinospora gelatinilytica TaxID=2666298 RepID=A0A2W2GFD7_9ACTN|nr:GNAT family N-acetyltransferase [Spongiactinospora gelatinilytica]PZG38935.1 GNAT family N-acetyltransferase [Spongiactinospora gelatinilytica]